MRRYLCLLGLLLLLCGCAGESGEREFAAFQESLGEEITFTAAITALSEREVSAFTAAFCRNGEESILSLTEPEALAGVTVRRRESEDTLSYDGLLLCLPELEGSALSPCEGFFALAEALREGRILRAWHEGDALAAELFVTDGCTATVYLAEGQPCRCELAQHGKAVLQCDITDWNTGDR